MKVRGYVVSGYMAAIYGSALALALRLTFNPYLGHRVFLVIYLPAVLVAALAGGLGPAILATGLCTAIGLAFIGNTIAANTTDLVELCFFAALGPVFGIIGGRLLRESEGSRFREAQLQSIVDTVPEAMVTIDDKGIMRSFSATAVRLFGWTAEEMIGRNVSVLMPSPYRKEHDSYLEHYRITGERRIIGLGRIVVAERKDGSTFPAELTVGEGQVGSQRFFTGFIRDLTERRTQERRVQELQSELVHVSRLTAMGEMASSLAHEINQPLSAVSNYMEGVAALLEQDHPDLTLVSDGVKQAAVQALRAGDIIKRLREFVAKGETAHTVENPAILLEEASALALFGAREQGVRVSLRCDRDIRPILVDKIQIQQVALNLIRNAIESMEASERRELTIAVEAAEDAALFSISDTGIGISPEIAERLFQPFVTTKPNGMGVGLSICRTIIEAHGGRIWADPNEDGGTVFNFTLPFADSEAGHVQ